MLFLFCLAPIALSQTTNLRDNVQGYGVKKGSPKNIPSGKIIGDPAWDTAPWTENFVDIKGIESHGTERQRTRAKFLYDDNNLYVAIEAKSKHIWTYFDKDGQNLYEQNALEIFLDASGVGKNYLEYQVSPKNNILSLLANKPVNGKLSTAAFNVANAQRGVQVIGTLNNPSDSDQEWRVTVALPWVSLSKIGPKPVSTRAKVVSWRCNLMRSEGGYDIVNNKYVSKSTGSSYDLQVWSTIGKRNIHVPEKYGILRFLP
jgi:hypothetical protein